MYGENLSLFSMYLGANIVPSCSWPTSLARSMMRRWPSSSMKPASPVRKYSPSKASAVASGFFRYSLNTVGPLISTSPLSENLSSIHDTGRPLVSDRTSFAGGMVTKMPASVMA